MSGKAASTVGNECTDHSCPDFDFCFSSRFAAFFSLVSSSLTFPPSARSKAFAHSSFFSISLRFSSSISANFALRLARWASAWVGLEMFLMWDLVEWELDGRARDPKEMLAESRGLEELGAPE